MASGEDFSPCDVDADRIAGQLRGKPAHRAVEGRGKQHGLARRRRQRAHALDVVDEAHVEHAVGFVQDEHLQLRQVDATAFDVVHQAAGGCDQQVDAALQRAVLHRVRRAAVETHGAHAQALAVAHRLLGDLLRELARRRQHQHARHARHPVLTDGRVGLRRDPVQRGQHEGRSLAGARLRRADDVAAFEQRRDRLRLDGRRLVVAARGERLQDLRREIQFFKTHVRFHSWTARHRRHVRRAKRRKGHARGRSPKAAAPRKVRTGGNEDGCGRAAHAEPNGHRATTHTHAPREAATGSTYCKAIVANRKLPIGATRAHGAETRAPECAPGRLGADDPVALGVQLAAGNLQSIRRRSPQGFDYTRKLDFVLRCKNGPPTKPVKPASAPRRRRLRHRPRRRHPRREGSSSSSGSPIGCGMSWPRRARRAVHRKQDAPAGDGGRVEVGAGVHYSGGMRSTCPG